MQQKSINAEAYDHQETERRMAEHWEEHGLYRFDPGSDAPIYSVDTPPPYVSAAHLHVGHAMSYSQAEFVVRYRRMRGYNVFYPMGFDDNGLPTERFVEKKYQVNKRNTTRSKFRELCIEETRAGAATYETMWRQLGLSVDWRQRYSTIDSHSSATAQKSFIDLYNKGLLYRANQPVLWDVVDETSLAQADLDTLSRKGKIWDIAFTTTQGAPLVISTTRPELIPACVGLFHAPGDVRYLALGGSLARVPLFDFDVPILESDDVDPAFGTGLMMVCTFGDGEDVKKWKAHALATRLVIDSRGRMTEAAGPLKGLTTADARAQIVKTLKADGRILAERAIDQVISVGERSAQPVEFQMAPQWFIRVLEFKEQLLARSAELEWHPPYMKVRLDNWIAGLKYDWNISRQRFYGVPLPIWYVQETGDVILADEADLPVDPAEDSPPQWALDKFAGLTIVGEADVMDTWMTSSLTPLINMNWVGSADRSGSPTMLPMSLRIQAFEIIRTWLFYTIVKSHYHCDQLPWKATMISGWGLNEQGKKISKRDLDQLTDSDGYNRYDPQAVIARYGADSLRYWAAGAHLGHDIRYNEKDVRAGRKVVVKLWNVARLCEMYLDDFDPDLHSIPVRDRPIEDRWLEARLSVVVAAVDEAFESYDFALGREAIERFFWSVLCDNYLEIVKDRLWRREVHGETSRRAVQTTLFHALRELLGILAPYIPFVTDDIYLRHYASREEHSSIHETAWPTPGETQLDAESEQRMQSVLDLLDSWRYVRTTHKLGGGRLLKIVLSVPDNVRVGLERDDGTLRSALRCDEIAFGPGKYAANKDGWSMDAEFSTADLAQDGA